MSVARSSAPRLAPGGPNLARRPFVNRRPVARVAMLLFVAGAVLLLIDLWLYVGYVRARQANATQLDAIEAQIEAERAALAAAEAELAAADVEHQNEVVAFMNRQLAERTFGWSVLFDRLAELLPNDVRLVNLGPRFVDEEGTPRRGASPGRDRVELAVQGAARDGEAILELVDALFADPAFENPNLSQESRQGGEVQFSLTVDYLPAQAEALAARSVEMVAPEEAVGDAPGDEEPTAAAGAGGEA